MLTACNSSRTTLRMLFSSLSVCSAARMLCTRNSFLFAGGTCCSNAHARRCCGSFRFGRKTYCGRFMPRFYGATRRSTRARIRLRSPYRPVEKSSYKGCLCEGYQIIQELAVKPLQLDHADLADRMIQGGALSFSSIWNHINKYLPDEAYTLINARLSRIKKTQ